MGQQTSQLEAGDLDVLAVTEGGQSRSQSPIEQSRRIIKTEWNSDDGSPQPFGKHNPSSQDFAFSSQVPLSASRNQLAYKNNGRTSRLEHERSSESPVPATMKREPSEGEAITPKPAKKKRRSRKRHSLTQENEDEQGAAGDNTANIDMKSSSADELHAFDPKSSMDLDGVSSSPIMDQALPTADRDLDNEMPTGAPIEMSPEELRRQEKRERKERKRAKKAAKEAERLRGSLLAANPNFGAHEGPETPAQARMTQMDSSEVGDGDHGAAKSSDISHQQSRNPARLDTQDDAGFAAGENVHHDTRMEDPNQLPTPDDEGPPATHDNTLDRSQNVAAITIPSSQPVEQPSVRKRKARDSDKKSRKRRKEQQRSSPELVGDSDEVGGESARGSAIVGTISSPLPTKQSPASAAKGTTSRIADLAREFYSQRYSGKNSTPTKSGPAAVRSKGSRPAELSPLVHQDSPSVTRLQRQTSSSARSSSERQLVKRERDEGGEDVAVESMDMDAVDEQDNGVEDNAHSIPDASMADDGGGRANNSSQASLHHFGSDDLGADPSMAKSHGQEASTVHEGTPSPADGQVIPESPVHQPSTNGKSKPLRQYGSKSSTTKKRQAKTSYIGRVAQDNIQAFAELPSPVAIVASRKTEGRAKHTTSPAVAGPSSATKGNAKQPKITSLMGGVPERSSTTPAPAPTSISRLPRNAPKIKNPTPQDEIKGPFTGNEIRNLAEVIETWRKDHELTDAQVKDMVQQNPQKDAKISEFWDYVHYACPQRKRQKVINQVRKTHHNFVARGTWTPEQHDELADLFETHGSNYKLLGQLINRHSDDVRDRIRNYVVCGKNRKRDLWSYDEEVKLQEQVTVAIDYIHKMKARGPPPPGWSGKTDDALVDWQLISERMGRTRSRLQCQTKWKQLRLKMQGGNIDGAPAHSMDEIIQGARNDFDEMTTRDLYMIAKALKRSGTLADSRIGWHKLRRDWSKSLGKWNRPALMLAWYRLRRSVPDWRIMSVPEIAQHHINSYCQTKEIVTLEEDELNLDKEYEEVARRVSRIIKGARLPKTPHLAIKSDEDEVDQQASINEDQDEPDYGDSDNEDEAPRVEEDILQSDPDDDVDQPRRNSVTPHIRRKLKARRSSQKATSKVEQFSDAMSDTSLHNASESSYVPKESVKASPSSGRPLPRASKTPRSKLAKQPFSTQMVDDDIAVSSDTDADNMEDIPAVLPD
ncbi:hypothetical protein SCAR479_13749 [Seiridium cardinale]|uniref:Myb-like domain-containing protein n=1 Tax=Seiridium cardinale TaxID=138064 RepID=A0ABR2X723_9PEZI